MNILIFSFLTGILASLTPCVYPMIPITIGILQAHSTKSLLRNFLISFFYVLGIATIYSILGYISATTTLLFGSWVSNPWVVGVIITIFLYFAFSMFGFYEFYIPNFLKTEKDVNIHGSIFYSFITGLLSGTVASPCLTPALAIVLSLVAKEGSPITGFLALFLFSFGMGLLLIFIGTFSTTLINMPKSGLWLIEIKKFFGFMLLAISVYFLQPFLAYNSILKLYAIIALIMALYYLISAKSNKFKILLSIFFIMLFVFLISRSMTRKIEKLAQIRTHRTLVYLDGMRTRC